MADVANRLYREKTGKTVISIPNVARLLGVTRSAIHLKLRAKDAVDSQAEGLTEGFTANHRLIRRSTFIDLIFWYAARIIGTRSDLQKSVALLHEIFAACPDAEWYFKAIYEGIGKGRIKTPKVQKSPKDPKPLRVAAPPHIVRPHGVSFAANERYFFLLYASRSGKSASTLIKTAIREYRQNHPLTGIPFTNQGNSNTTSEFQVTFGVVEDKEFLAYVAQDGRTINALIKAAIREYRQNHPL